MKNRSSIRRVSHTQKKRKKSEIYFGDKNEGETPLPSNHGERTTAKNSISIFLKKNSKILIDFLARICGKSRVAENAVRKLNTSVE